MLNENVLASNLCAENKNEDRIKESLIMEKLNARPKQNFSAILNCPTDNLSYLEEFKNMIYSTIYDEKSSLSSEISKDYEKFSNVDIEIASSGSSTSIQSLKELLNESLTEYVNSIIGPYRNFKANHYNSPNPKDKQIVSLMSSGSINFENEDNFIYKTNKKVLNNIDSCYLADTEKYKLKSDLFGMKRNELEKNWMNLIKKSDYVEVELNKILSHSFKIQKFITDHFYSLNDNVNSFYMKIIEMKIVNQNFKKKYIETSTKLLSKGIKKKNIKKIHNQLKTFKKLKDILDLLKILAPNKNKAKITFDLIDKARDIIEINKSNKKECSKIFNVFEDNLAIYVNKIFELKNDEFSTMMKNYFFQFLSFSEQNTNLFNYMSENFLTKLKNSSPTINYILSYINFDTNKPIDPIISLINFYIKFEVLTTFYTKIRGLLTQSSNEILKDVICKLNQKLNENSQLQKKDEQSKKEEILKDQNENEANLKEENKKEESKNEENLKEDNVKEESKNELQQEEEQPCENNDLGDKEKNEQCILLCILCARTKLIQRIEFILNEILIQIQNNPLTQSKKYEIIKRNFADEFKEIVLTIKSNFNNVVNNQIIKCLNEALNHSNLDFFFDNLYLTREIVGPENDFNDLFLKCQKEFIVNWTNSKLLKLNTNLYQNWEQISEIPPNYQMFVILFQNNEINKVHIVGKNKEEYYKNYETVKNYFVKKEANISQEEMKNYIQFLDKKFRCNQCILDIIQTSYEAVKLFSFLEFKTWENLLYSYTKLLSSYSIYQNDQIIKGKNSIVSQTEISMTYSIVRLIKEYRSRLAKCDSFSIIKKNVSDTCIESFFSLSDLLENISLAAKNKINNLIEIHCIENSIKDLEKIKLPDYNVVEGDTPLNDFAINLIKLLITIHDSMIECFEDDFIKLCITTHLKKFFDKFENFVFKGQKIENENCLKQFRRDMIFLKKNLGSLSLVDTHEFKNRIDNINKKVLPESMLKPKK